MGKTSATIELGDKVEDIITGFQGVVTGRCTYISGCDQVLVSAQAPGKSKKGEANWFDIDRCEVVTKTAVKLADVSSVERPGADIEAPIK